MPQLIAMIIVVVGALIYMFQTFGGTGDKIEGIAQKTSVLTEINNIKDGVKLAARTQAIGNGDNDDPDDAVSTLEGLAVLSYFAEQVNDQLDTTTTDTNNTYKAISFGADDSMTITLITQEGKVPGLYVDLTGGSLSTNAGFLEAQIANDLKAVAYFDRLAVGTTAGTGTAFDSNNAIYPSATTGGTGTDSDGKFAIYFKDFSSAEVVK